MEIDKILEELSLREEQLNEMTAYQDPSKTIEQYLANIERAAKRGNTKARCATINGIRIPDECFRHNDTEFTVHGHDLSKEEWKQFMDSINIEKDHRIKSNKSPRYNGEPHLYTVEIGNKYYGYVLELFPKKLPILVTAFWNDYNSIESWIYNNSQRKSETKKESN